MQPNKKRQYPAQHLQVGILGELIAKNYLKEKGYEIIEQNYRTKFAEIDLIVKQKNILVFVEVRTKTGELFGLPEETINRKKREKLNRNAVAYATMIEWKKQYQIDAICIVLKQCILSEGCAESENHKTEKNYKLERLNHYKNIC